MFTVLTWNINGIRACKSSLDQLFKVLDADVICLQETKVTRDALDEVTAIVEGYNSYFSCSQVKSGYSGVATYVRDKATPVKAEEGLSGIFGGSIEQMIGCYGDYSEFTDEELRKLDCEGRCIMTQHQFVNSEGLQQQVVIFNVYCPRAEPGNAERLAYKLQYYRLLELRAMALLNSGMHVVIVGDINTSHRKIDHCNPDTDEEFVSNPGRQWMDSFLLSSSDELQQDNSSEQVCRQLRFFDTFRWLHPEERNAFTNWCTLTGARATNYGCRLDYIMADVGLLNYLASSHIMPEVDGSDHCPVKTKFCVTVLASPKCPPLCTKYLPQFVGRQQKLVKFLTRKSETNERGCCNVDRENLEVTCRSERNGADNARLASQSLVAVSAATYGALAGTEVERPSGSNGGIKRRAADTVPRHSKQTKNSESNQQRSLFAYFDRPNSRTQAVAPSCVKSKTSAIVDQSVETKTSTACGVVSPISADVSCLDRIVDSDESSTEGQVQVRVWKNLLKGPPPTPMCKGHNEPCVLRTVKKDGPNKGKQFWVCNRPQGHQTNPEARCNYFVWVSHSKP